MLNMKTTKQKACGTWQSEYSFLKMFIKYLKIDHESKASAYSLIIELFSHL